MEKREIICPIIFEKKVEEKKEVIQPIGFIKKPITFIGKQQTKSGAYETFETDDERLANASIPYGRTKEEYILFAEETKQVINSIGSRSNIVQDKNIVRAQEKPEIVDAITNYEIFPIEKRIYIDGKGNVQSERNDIELCIRIKTCNGIVEERMCILYKELNSVTQIIAKRFPTAIVYDRKNVYKIENALREKIAVIREMRVYTCAGWQEIDNVKVYIHKSQCLKNGRVLTELNLLSSKNYKINELVEIYRRAIGLYDVSGTAAILVAYSLMGVSYRIFDEAGYAPHFLLFINGKTGSFKTAISKVLYMQLVDDEHRDFPRRIDADTVTSFERALVESGRDTVTLYDDYAPAKNVQDQRALDSKLEVIIRMIGDGSTKSRSNIALEDKRGEGVKGAVVLTGELRGKGLSSNLRCLYCEIEKEHVNTENLSWLQKHRDGYTTLIQHYVFYLSQRWDEFVTTIKENFEKRRVAAGKILKSGRMVDTFVILLLLLDMLEMFLIEYCSQDENAVSYEIRHLKGALESSVVQSEVLSEKEDPATIFMKALVSVMEKNNLYIIPKRDLASMAGKMIDGCEDENYVYLIPDSIYTNVVRWLRSIGVSFMLDLPRLGEMLCQSGYAMATSNGSNKKTYYARLSVGNGKRINFLKIPKSIIADFQGKIGQVE